MEKNTQKDKPFYFIFAEAVYTCIHVPVFLLTSSQTFKVAQHSAVKV